MAQHWFQEGLRRCIDRAMAGNVDLLADTIKMVLVSSGYTPNKDHQFVSDLGANELSGTGYVGGFGGSGRKTLASKVIGKNDTTDKMYFDGADPTWTAINAGTVRYIAFTKEITSDAASPILFIVEFTTNNVTNGGDWTAAWDAAGIARIAA